MMSGTGGSITIVSNVLLDCRAFRSAAGKARAMPANRIDLKTPAKGYGKTLMSYLGEPIGASDSPIYAGARWLLANGHASPDDTVATYRGKTLCMSGKAGELAKWTVQEMDRRGTRTCGFWTMTAHALISGCIPLTPAAA
jgi:hypothetical protein